MAGQGWTQRDTLTRKSDRQRHQLLQGVRCCLKKKYLDAFPIPSRSLERYYKVNGATLEKNYKECLSGFRAWGQLDHASDWILLAENIGESLGIDESMHQKDLFTFLSNKDGHGRKGTLIAAVRGTKAPLWLGF